MTQKIDEVCEKVLPTLEECYCMDEEICNCPSQRIECRDKLKSAIERGDLWLSCSVEDMAFEIFKFQQSHLDDDVIKDIWSNPKMVTLFSKEKDRAFNLATAIHTMMKERK